MRSTIPMWITLFVSTAAGGQGLTSGPPPVKMGLWETTMTGMMSPNGIKARVCVTKESYETSFARLPPGCAISNANRTATHISADIACTINSGTTTAQSSGHFEVDFPDAETSRSTVTMNLTINGQPQTITLRADGKFVSADCGTVAPGKAQIMH